MATKTLKCPARITMLKTNPIKFIVSKGEHVHAMLKRGKYSNEEFKPKFGQFDY